jgi:orotate phosphoribosyltransferase
MAKATIYVDLFSTKTISVKECPLTGEKPYQMNFNKALSSPSLFDNITLLLEHTIKTKNLQFDKICATSSSAIPYATNVATSLEKGILYINHTGNDCDDKDNIKNIKIEGGMNIDDRILLIETIVSNDFLLNNIISKIRKYGGNIVGLVLIMNLCEGEYINLSQQKENIINVLNIYDVFNHLENNNLIELYYCEKVKFYCENVTKTNIKKLLPQPKEDIVEQKEQSLVTETECKEESSKEPFVGQ